MDIILFLVIVFILCALCFFTGLRTADSYHRELEVEMRRDRRFHDKKPNPNFCPPPSVLPIKETHSEPDSIGISLTDRVFHGDRAVSFGSVFHDAGRIQ